VSESPKLSAIRDKVRSGERLSEEDGIALFLEPDLLAVGALANEVREKRHGDRTYFNRNMRVEVTNVCVASCGPLANSSHARGARSIRCRLKLACIS